MRKLLSLSLILLLLFVLAACGGNKQSTTSGKNTGSLLKEVSAQPAQTEKSKGKILIAYFSQARMVSEGADAIASSTPYVGNTASAAYEIQKIIGGDIFEIATAKSYPVDHRECSRVAEQELKENVRPELTTHVKDMDSYDVIFIGYPIWWYVEPMAIRTFLEEYNFSGKTIVPFCTTLGAGIPESVKNIVSLCPNATILDGLTLRAGSKDMSADISRWLTKIGISR